MADSSGSFFEFGRLAEQLGTEPTHTGKATQLAAFLARFSGDVYVFFRLLLVKEDSRVFHQREKTLVKVLAPLLGADALAMRDDVNAGDVSMTVRKFFDASGRAKARSTYTLGEIDKILDEFAGASSEADQTRVWRNFLARSTADDVMWFTRLLVGDIKTKMGAKMAVRSQSPPGRYFARC